jgi:hypothetical protein
MTIGSGIAVTAIWGCAAVSMVAPRVSGTGVFVTLIAALVATIAIVVWRESDVSIIDAALETAARAMVSEDSRRKGQEDMVWRVHLRDARTAVVAFVKALPGSPNGWNKAGILSALGEKYWRDPEEDMAAVGRDQR